MVVAGLVSVVLVAGDSGDARWLLTADGLAGVGLMTFGLGLYLAVAEVALGLHREPERPEIDPRVEEWAAMVAKRRNGHGRSRDRTERR